MQSSPVTHDSWYSTCVSTHTSPNPLWDDCGASWWEIWGRERKKDEEEGRDKVQLREKPLTQKKRRTAVHPGAGWAGAGPRQGGCAVSAGNCWEQLGMRWQGGSVRSCDYDSWPRVRPSPSKGPRLLLLRAETEGFCLPLRVPACKRCKMVPLFLEARTATARGLG